METCAPPLFLPPVTRREGFVKRPAAFRARLKSSGPLLKPHAYKVPNSISAGNSAGYTLLTIYVTPVSAIESEDNVSSQRLTKVSHTVCEPF